MANLPRRFALPCTCLVLSCLMLNIWYAESFCVEDLSHVVGTSMIPSMFFVNQSFMLTSIHRGPYLDAKWMEAKAFTMQEHMGTHVDAPAHVLQGGEHLSEISLYRLIGPGIVIDSTEKAEKDIDYRLTVDDILAWEKRLGLIPAGAIVCMRTNWTARYNTEDMQLIFGSKTPENIRSRHFPSFGLEAAEFLINKRKVSVLGVDTPSVDFGQSTTFDVHSLMAKKGIVGVEFLNNLELLPPSGFTIFIAPIKLAGGTGGPARVFAVVSGNCVH